MPIFDSSFDSTFETGGESWPSLPVRIQVGAFGAPALSVALQVLPAGLLDGSATLADGGNASATWAPVVRLAGVDIKDMTIDSISVDAQEGAARVASLVLLPVTGQVINMAGWTGRALTIDFAGIVGGAPTYPVRLFTGVVDVPRFDPVAGTISLLATDDLQGVCAALTDAQVDFLVAGKWSQNVFDPARSRGWQRCLDRLSTRPASLDLSPWRAPRVTAWSGAPTMVLDADQIEDGSLRLELPERGEIINRVEIVFSYRFPLLRRVGWAVNEDFVGPTGYADFVNEGRVPLSRSAVTESMQSAGVYPVELNFIALPTVSVPVGGGVWLPNPVTDPLLCLGFTGSIGFDWTQTREERHAIRVENAASVAAVGVQTKTMSGALENEEFATDTWEARRWQLTTGQNAAFTPADPPAVVVGAITAKPAPATPRADRAAANLAIETLIDIAKTDIAASHRKSRVTVTVPLNPALDLDKYLQIDTAKVAAAGKVVGVAHEMDPHAGRAVTVVSIAVSSLSGVGITHPETPTAASAAPIVPQGYDSPPVIVYDSMVGDSSFEMTFPAITDAARNVETVPISATVAAPVAEDLFTITT